MDELLDRLICAAPPTTELGRLGLLSVDRALAVGCSNSRLDRLNLFELGEKLKTRRESKEDVLEGDYRRRENINVPGKQGRLMLNICTENRKDSEAEVMHNYEKHPIKGSDSSIFSVSKAIESYVSPPRNKNNNNTYHCKGIMLLSSVENCDASQMADAMMPLSHELSLTFPSLRLNVQSTDLSSPLSSLSLTTMQEQRCMSPLTDERSIKCASNDQMFSEISNPDNQYTTILSEEFFWNFKFYDEYLVYDSHEFVFGRLIWRISLGLNSHSDGEIITKTNSLESNSASIASKEKKYLALFLYLVGPRSASAKVHCVFKIHGQSQSIKRDSHYFNLHHSQSSMPDKYSRSPPLSIRFVPGIDTDVTCTSQHNSIDDVNVYSIAAGSNFVFKPGDGRCNYRGCTKFITLEDMYNHCIGPSSNLTISVIMRSRVDRNNQLIGMPMPAPPIKEQIPLFESRVGDRIKNNKCEGPGGLRYGQCDVKCAQSI